MESKRAIDFVKRTLSEGDYGYTLREYLKLDTWDHLLSDNMEGITFINMTDFNYNRCFSYYFMEDIQLSQFFFTVKAREEVIQRGYIEFIGLNISAIGPFFYIDKGVYEPDGERLKIKYIDHFKNDQLEQKYKNLIERLDERLYIVEPDDLKIQLKGVPLENVEPEKVTYGRYLFS